MSYARGVVLSDLDLHLFGEGTHRRLWELLGAHELPGGGVRFAVWAPNARSVEVLGDWNGWASGSLLQPQGKSGIWALVCPAAVAGQRYKFGVTSAAVMNMLSL